jgi:arylsulfatase A-like enzyme
VKRNVIVVMFDSLGANYVGAYGNTWIQTPNMDRLAKEGILFENNYIDNLPTIPCRRSMFTGRYSVQSYGWSPLTLEETTIADLCWGRPIDTALVYDAAPLRLPKFGYSRGFDKVHFTHGNELDTEYYHTDPLYHLDPRDYIEDRVLEAAGKLLGRRIIEPLLSEITDFLRQRQYWQSDEDQNVAQVMKAAVGYLQNADRNKQFFLWIDSFDPHEPWDPPSVYDPDLTCPYDPDYKGKDMFLPLTTPVEGIYIEPELNHIRALHAEKVTVCDKWLGYLLENVRRLGLEENTLFLLVSDHGEPLGHGKDGHGLMRKCRPWPYDELARAPMIMRGPGLPAGKRVQGFTQSCDVGPTVTDWLGIGVHPEMTGRSLLPLAKGEVDTIRDFAIAGYHKFSTAIYTKDWSYVHWRRPTDKTEGIAVRSILGGEMAKAMRSVGASTERGYGKAISDAAERLQQHASLDGEDMWTCVPGSLAEVPQNDELYDRVADPCQLNDVAAQKPKMASELFATLRDFMAELRTT